MLLAADGGTANGSLVLRGKAMQNGSPLTAWAFREGLGRVAFGNGHLLVTLAVFFFGLSTAISWSYYGGRAVTYLWGTKYVIFYRIIYVIGFFIASFTDTTIVWNLSYITIAIMTIPNLFGLLVLRRDIRDTIRTYWTDFRKDWPMEKHPMGTDRR